MPVMKLSNQEEVQKWYDVIQNFEAMLTILNEDSQTLKKFCKSRLETAQFWKRYASERTSDTKLKEIASRDLEVVEIDIEFLDSVVPSKLEEILAFLKAYQWEV